MDLYALGAEKAVRTFFPQEKTAILGSLALGAGLHAGANLGFRTFRGTEAGKHFQAGQMASGYNQALQGQKINPVARNVATFGVGPESMVPYDMGQALGGQMAGLGKGDQYRQLKKMRKNMAMTTHLKNAPGTSEVVPAINRILDQKKGFMDKLPTVPIGAKPTLGQNLMSGGLAAGAIAAEPHTAIHMGINATRDAIARDRIPDFIRTRLPGLDKRFPNLANRLSGKKFMKDQFEAGVDRGMPSPKATLATDLAVSPAALDTRRIGSALAAEYKDNPQAMRRLGGSALGTALKIPNVRQQVSEASGGLPPELLGQLPLHRILR